MTIASEGLTAPGDLQTALDAGLESIDRNQTILFTEYTKSVISVDGSVFWVKSSTTETVKGSLHYATDRAQEEDQTIGINTVIFTSEEEVTLFNTISPTTMWVGEYKSPGALDATIKIAFSKRGSFYEQASLWHYSGFAVYPALSAQLVNSALDLPVGPIVSNSLPIWLTQTSFASVYPSYLVPANVVPPYIVAHIEPAETTALQPFPKTTLTTNQTSGLYQMNSDQLMRDRVRLTLYGFTNQTAIQFMESLIDYSLNTDNFGFCSDVQIQDDKRVQAEISTIAQKKTLEFLASYYQSTADAIARRLILSATMAVTV